MEGAALPVPKNLGHDRACPSILPLRELEAFASAGLAGFLALFHSRVATKKALCLERAPQISIHLQKRARDRESHRAGLTGRSAACGVDGKIVDICHLYRLQWLQDRILERRRGKIILKAAAVDIDLATPRGHANASDGSFATTGCDEFFSFGHLDYSLG